MFPLPLKNAKAEFSSKLISNCLLDVLLNLKVSLNLVVFCENNPIAPFPIFSFELSSKLIVAFPSE